MNILNLRKYHRWAGIVLAPFFLLIAITGFILILSVGKLVNIPSEIFQITFQLHTWEFLGTVTGLIFATGLMYMVITGTILFIAMEVKRRKSNIKH